MKRFFLIAIAFLPILLSACPSSSPAGLEDAFEAADTALPDGAICEVGAKRCVNDKLLTCTEGGFAWYVEDCAEDEACIKDACVKQACKPYITKCADEKGIVMCLPDGLGYGEPVPCKEDESCIGGICVAKTCLKGDKECTTNSILTCKDDGNGWLEEPCGNGKICYKNQCIECIDDEHCESGFLCKEGLCVSVPLEITTESLPDGALNTAYSAELEAIGGKPPYTWSLSDGALPDGLALQADGKISGTPSKQGLFEFKVKATDAASFVAEKGLSINVLGEGLHITTKSLPDGEDGTPYKVQLKAVGGTEPYAWMIKSGSLPKGLTLASGGETSGMPEGAGDFPFTVKVFDSSEPYALTDAKELSIKIKIAPLQIVGDQIFDLMITKVIVLPMITIVEGIPIPYSTQLQAKGGQKPYSWKEIPLPNIPLLPKSGIPQGLTLSASGHLSGAVTSTQDVVSLDIPFVNITLKGFFFMAEVSDSQQPADSDQGIFLIPTIPIGGNGGFGLPF